MKKMFLSLLIILGFHHLEATEWYGFIPVRVIEGTPYFLLRTSSASTLETKFVPALGSNLAPDQTKDSLLIEQLQPLTILSSKADLKRFFEKLPYLFYQDKINETNQTYCFRFWWPSSFFQTRKSQMDSQGLTNISPPEIDFFGFPLSSIDKANSSDTKKNSDSIKYKIYFVAVKGLPKNSLLTEQTQWFSIEEIAAAAQETTSPFLEKLITMFNMMDKGSIQKWEIANNSISRDINNRLKNLL